MATKYEYNDTAGEVEAYGNASGNVWLAQTFTPQIKHAITSVKLKGYRVGSIGTITISIRATSSETPTGADLTSGTYNGNLLPASANGVPPGGSEWFEVLLTTYTLTANTMYVIVIKAPSTGTLACKLTYSGDPYANGKEWESTDSGSTWASYNVRDYLFEEYGNLVGGEGAGIIAVVEDRFHYIDAYGVQRFIKGTVVT